MLSAEQYQKAVEYIKGHARPLEKALYAYHFEGGSKEAVLAELAHYQNPDGGFGKALEPEIRLEDSSGAATIVAFRKFRELELSANTPMIAQAAHYLLQCYNGYDTKHNRWQLVPPHVDDAPHAPWWEFDVYDGFMTIEVLGYLYDYLEYFPNNLKQHLAEKIIDRLSEYHPDIDEEEGEYFLAGYLALLESKNLPEEIYSQLIKPITWMVSYTVDEEPMYWSNYSLKPLSILSSKQSPFYPRYKAIIPQNIDSLVNSLTSEGYWSSYHWHWDVISKEGWTLTERDYRGINTLKNLIALKTFDGIEGL